QLPCPGRDRPGVRSWRSQRQPLVVKVEIAFQVAERLWPSFLEVQRERMLVNVLLDFICDDLPGIDRDLGIAGRRAARGCNQDGFSAAAREVVSDPCRVEEVSRSHQVVPG